MDTDDELIRFEAEGAPPLPAGGDAAYTDHDGARIWHAAYGDGPAVVLLHGGLGHSGNWGYQVPALVAHGYRAVVIDSRGHGRSSADNRPYAYARMGADVRAVLDARSIAKAAIVGWSDGATIGWFLAKSAPERVAGLFFFGANLDLSGAKDPFDASPLIDRCFARHARDYAALSPAPGAFRQFVGAVTAMMQREPNCSAAELAAASVPMTLVHAERDEFIHRAHSEYLAGTIPNAELRVLPGVSHFAPLQRPEAFNDIVLAFARRFAR